jgi:hypothetical protein
VETASAEAPIVPAGTRVTASAANGDVLADTIVGSASSTISAAHGRGGTFVRNAAEPQSWLVEGSVAVPADLGEWFDRVVNIPGTDLSGIAVLIGDKVVFEAQKPDPKSGEYQIVHMDESVGPSDSVANNSIIHNLGAGIVNVKVEDARALESVTPGPTARTDRYTITGGLQIDVTLVDADNATWAIIKASAPEGSDAAKTAATINAAAGRWALRLGSVETKNLQVEVSRLVQPPNANPQGAGQVGVPPGGQAVPFPTPGIPTGPALPNF